MITKSGHRISCPINWKLLPEWVQFITIDWDGAICCWGKRPMLSKSLEMAEWIIKDIEDTEFEYAGKYYFTPDKFDCTDCIWERPKTTQP